MKWMRKTLFIFSSLFGHLTPMTKQIKHYASYLRIFFFSLIQHTQPVNFNILNCTLKLVLQVLLLLLLLLLPWLLFTCSTDMEKKSNAQFTSAHIGELELFLCRMAAFFRRKKNRCVEELWCMQVFSSFRKFLHVNWHTEYIVIDGSIHW